MFIIIIEVINIFFWSFGMENSHKARHLLSMGVGETSM